MSREPVVRSVELCRGVLVDPATGEWSLVGLVHKLTADALPYLAPRLAVYVALTDAVGRLALGLRVADADDARPAVLDITVEFTAADPLGVSQMDATLDHLRFPAAGMYAVQLLFDGKLLAERRLHVAAGD